MRSLSGASPQFHAILLLVAPLFAQLACRPAPDLILGSSRQATIGVDVAHVYRLRLEAGQYARLLLEQRGADVETTIRLPSGRAWFRLDLRTVDARDVEPIHLLAPRTGTYSVEVVLADPETAGGAYRVAFEVLRPALPADREAAAATRAFAAGRVLRKLADRAADDAAAAYSARAAVLLERAIVLAARSAPFLEAYVREELAFMLRKRGTLQSATEAYETAWQRAKLLDGQQDHPRFWATGTALASLLAQSGRLGEAIATWQELATWAGARDDTSREAIARARLASLYRRLGRSDLALAEYQWAIERQRALGNRLEEADLWVNMGQALTKMGDQERALVSVEHGLALYARADPRGSNALGRAFVLNARGDVLRRLGRVAESLEIFRQSLRWLERAAAGPGGGAEKGTLERRRAVAFLGLARGFEADHPALAWPLYQHALGLAEGNQHHTAVTLASMGRLLSDLDQPDAAVSLLARAVALREEQGASRRNGLASSLYALARAHFGAGRLDQAKRTIDRALGLVESLRELEGAVSLRSTYLESKQQYYDLSIEILMALERERPGRGYAIGALEKAERRRARTLGDRLAAASEGERAKVSPALRATEHTLWQALLAAERQRDRLYDRVRQGGRSRSGNGRGGPLAADRAALRAAEALLEEQRIAYQALASRLRQEAPAYRPARPALSIDAMRAQLDDNTLLLVYNLGERSSHVWALGHDPQQDALTSHRLPPRHALEPLIDQVWRGLQRVERRPSRRADQRRALEALSAKLLPPGLVARLDRERLLVVKDGALHSLPFGALALPSSHPRARPEDEAGLVDRLLAAHEIVVTPSVGVLAQLRERPPAPRASRIAVVADAVYQPSDPRLPTGPWAGDDPPPPAHPDSRVDAGSRGVFPRLVGSRAEGEAILAIAPPGSRGFFGFAARRELLVGDQLEGFGYLHLGVHGDPRFGWPGQAALILSGFDAGGAAIEGRVTAGEIQRCRIDAHTVVLSACGSGLGRAVRGEGLVGLSQAFLVAGAQRTLVSLWPVEDRATQVLMKRFYQQLLVEGLAPAAALRESQLSMARQVGWRAPGSWAGFEIHGDWRAQDGLR